MSSISADWIPCYAVAPSFEKRVGFLTFLSGCKLICLSVVMSSSLTLDETSLMTYMMKSREGWVRV